MTHMKEILDTRNEMLRFFSYPSIDLDVLHIQMYNNVLLYQ